MIDSRYNLPYLKFNEDELLNIPSDSFVDHAAKACVNAEEEAIKQIITAYAEPPIDCNQLNLYEILARMKEQNISFGEFQQYQPYRKCVMQNGKQIGPKFYLEQEWDGYKFKATVMFDNR